MGKIMMPDGTWVEHPSTQLRELKACSVAFAPQQRPPWSVGTEASFLAGLQVDFWTRAGADFLAVMLAQDFLGAVVLVVERCPQPVVRGKVTCVVEGGSYGW